MSFKFKEKFRKLYRNFLKILPTKLVLNIENFRGYHKLINFKNPKYFGEKIQWLKLYGNLEKYSKFVDKLAVRDYIKEKIGSEYLNDLIAVYTKTEEIEYDNLPQKFVLKLNTGSGYNIIVDNKDNIDGNKINKKINKWLNEDYYKIKKESQYKNIDKKILIENYLEDSNKSLQDYKFYCFDGKIEFVEVDFDRYSNHTMNFYDLDWNLLNLKKGSYENFSEKFLKPKNFDLMINLVSKIAEDFQFARIDFYNIDGKIYFGEITLTPAGGLTPFKPLEKDIEYAKKIKLKKNNCKNILYIGRISAKRKILDGVTIKAKVLLDKLMDKNNVNVIDVDNWKKNFLKIGLEFLKYYKNNECIVICSSSPGAKFFLKVLKLIKNKKRVYYFVSGGSLGEKIGCRKYPINIYKNIYRIYVESEFMKKEFLKHGLEQTEVIYNFRNPKIKFRSIKTVDNEIKFVFFGRVVKNKGIEEAIKLIKRLNDKEINATLDIYGQVEEAYLQQLQIQKCKNINYKGAIEPDGVTEYKTLHQYDIFIFPTEHNGEGLPGALIDSYISGLAVIASNWKYANEYIYNNINGVIFEYKNYEDMFEKTLELLKNKKTIEKYKIKSLELSNKYIIDYVIPKELNGE